MKRSSAFVIVVALTAVAIITWYVTIPLKEGKGSSAPSHPQAPVAQVGCCEIATNVEKLCNGSNMMVQGNCSCVDILTCRMVAVTSLSSNHFSEARGYFGSLQRFYPRLKIVVYDIGLNDRERTTLRTYCNVAEVRRFPFEKYPRHVRSLHLYSWKPLVVQEASKDFEVILYGDSSVRMLSSDIAPAVNALLTFPFLSGSPHTKIVGLTHDGMITYLRSPPRHELGMYTGTQGGVWLMWANGLMKSTVIPEWADCALHTECIAPEGGTQLYSCNLAMRDKYDDGRYIGCHRYDQAAISMILARDFGVGVSKYVVRYDISDKLWLVDRDSSTSFEVRKC